MRADSSAVINTETTVPCKMKTSTAEYQFQHSTVFYHGDTSTISVTFRTDTVVKNSSNQALRPGFLHKLTHNWHLWQLCLSSTSQMTDWLIIWKFYIVSQSKTVLHITSPLCYWYDKQKLVLIYIRKGLHCQIFQWYRCGETVNNKAQKYTQLAINVKHCEWNNSSDNTAMVYTHYLSLL